ncbi:MAG: helix-turn-helix transcriptional regulator [Deltaproteobacteria bacterium]|nr:helix-turn-helix transcriptional regulator [Nannocystaceae bacterium]
MGARIEAGVVVALADCRIARAWDDGVEIVEGSPRPRAFPRRLSTGLGVCLKRSGLTHTVVADGRTLRYPGDAICVRPPGCVWSCDPVDARFLSIDFEPRLLPEDAVFAPMSLLPSRAIAVAKVIHAVLDASDGMAREQALVELLASLSRHGLVRADELASTHGGAAAAVRARDRLAVDLAEELSLEQLAAEAGCSKYVLLRAFKRRWGITPHALRVCLRIEAARRLLARGHASVEVAAMTGFADQSHLGRHFKTIVGVTPAAYRNA